MSKKNNVTILGTLTVKFAFTFEENELPVQRLEAFVKNTVMGHASEEYQSGRIVAAPGTYKVKTIVKPVG